MKVYEDDSDQFTAEYMAYLTGLTSEVITGAKVRLTSNPEGFIVRIEVWDGEDHSYYRDIPLPGWMET